MKIPQKDKLGKLSAFVQLLCFLLLFLGIYLIGRHFVHAWYLRILILLADYAVVSLVTFTLIKPLAEKLENRLRK